MVRSLSSVQILAMNANNATSNDTQGETLTEMPNSFELENHVCCFNHTLQLLAKTLLCPFNTGLGKKNEDGDNNDVDDLLNLGVDDEEEDVDDEDEDEDLPGLPDIDDVDNVDDGIDELDELDAAKREDIIADTAAIHETVSKLCHLTFAIIQLTTIALPAWHRYCKELKLKSCILPHDVVTHWNSTYYMLSFAVKYRSAIDAMTADKSLKLQNYELETEEWVIAEDLVAIMLVCIHIVGYQPMLTPSIAIQECNALFLVRLCQCCHSHSCYGSDH